MFRPFSPRAAALASAVLLAASAQPADAQGFADRLRRKAEEAAKRAAEQRVERRAGDATNAAMDAAEQTARGTDAKAADAKAADAKAAEAKGAEASGAAATTAATPAATPAASSPTAAPAAAAAPAPALKTGEGAFVNFDFVPGDRVLFADDFAGDNVGDFPKRLEFAKGNMEVAEWQGARFLRVSTDGEFSVPLPAVLPERFTVEFDYAGMNKYELKMDFTDPKTDGHSRVLIGAWGAGVTGAGVEAMTPPAEASINGVAKVRVMADGRYVKVYVDGLRVANVPNAQLGRANRIWFQVPPLGEAVGMVGNLRVAEGGKKLYDVLAAKGRVATQGIYFDTGSDRVRAESNPTLKEIAAMLGEHADLRLTIEGHTDDRGDAAANTALSERRAAAVRQALVSSFGVDGARLTARGLGSSKPAAPNTTSEGRQTNRRVELVKS